MSWLRSWIIHLLEALRIIRRRPPPRPILEVAEEILQKHGDQVRELVCRDPPVPDVTFELSETLEVPAATAGTKVILSRRHFQENPDDIGAIVHEIAHAIQRAARYEGEFVWMIEGIGDFIRHHLDYGTVEEGDPRGSYRKAAGFFNWLYQRHPDIYREVVSGVNEGSLYPELDRYIALYRAG